MKVENLCNEASAGKKCQVVRFRQLSPIKNVLLHKAVLNRIHISTAAQFYIKDQHTKGMKTEILKEFE
jgi:hypothetical protein